MIWIQTVPLLLSLRITAAAMLLLLPVGLMAAWWLGTAPQFTGKTILELFLMLPLVLPPTVVGYGLLLLLGRGTAWGIWLNDTAHVQLLFTWEAASLAAAIMGMPLFIRTAAAAFASVEPELLEAGRTLGANEWVLLWRVLIPLAYRGLIAGGSLACARALGEFGATFMVAGSIAGKTQTLPLALYEAVQSGDDSAALRYALILTAIAFVLLGFSTAVVGRVTRGRG